MTVEEAAETPEALEREVARARRRGIVRFFGRLAAHRSFRVGFALFFLIVLTAVFADLIAPYEPNKNNYRSLLAPPSMKHWFGTDGYGRDILSRVIHGTRISLGIGISVVVMTGVFGVFLGMLAGYVRWLDNLLMRVMDGLMAFPGVLLAIALAAALGPSALNAVIALTVTFTPRTARIVRSSVLVIRALPYVEAAVAVGAGHGRIIFRYILVNALSPLIVQLTFVFAVSILAEAILSFLGVGPPPPAPSLGNIIAEGRTYLQEAGWIAFFPGIAIAAAVLGLNLMGDGLRDVTDPQLRQGREAG
ncbi:ABC transporter permease [Pseudohoeflea coraliihabitans]|uniref:ABC transporter permease n=1 Tax=Pseudohoeflea coraliihabitans TaxID=2860393 RepID=A0ABS6WKS4_9HYPH|nr:ABC transporter permease [Pseudohoeflea sp. DP4N28-3]MBW3095699.1 ABC transporter permease [Pseudohoeflea sp. DP4N28-3]